MTAARRLKAAAAPPPSIEGPSSSTNNSALTSYTFTNMGIGLNRPGKRLIVVVETGNTGGAQTVSSVTVGGASAVARFNPNVARTIGVFTVAAPPAGSTANVVVNYGTAPADGCRVRMYVIYDAANSAPSDSSNAVNDVSGGSLSFSVSVPNSGVTFGVAAGDTGNAHNWGSQITEQVESDFGGVMRTSIAMREARAGGSQIFSVGYAANSANRRMFVMTWR